MSTNIYMDYVDNILEKEYDKDHQYNSFIQFIEMKMKWYGLHVNVDRDVFIDMLKNNDFSIEATTVVLLDILNSIREEKYYFKGIPHNYHLTMDEYKKHYKKNYRGSQLYNDNKSKYNVLLGESDYWRAVHEYK